MATRIKRYEERLDQLDDLLARIEAEMGPEAELETREFTRGRVLGLFGGQRMVEVIATLEVDGRDQLRQQLATPVPAARPPVSEPEPPGELNESMVTPLPTPQPATASAARSVDLTADAPVSVPLIEAEQPAEPRPIASPARRPTPVPRAADPPRQHQAPVRPPLQQAAPARPPLQQAERPTTVPAPPVAPKASPPPAVAPSVNTQEIQELKQSIVELKDTVRLLIQQQQLALQKAPAAAPVEAAPPQEASKPATADPLALDDSVALSAIERQAYERLLDWNIGPYDAMALVNSALSAVGENERTTEQLLAHIKRDICRNILLSGGIQLRKSPPGKAVALIGATGVGKTTTIAKLAAHFAFQQGKRVSLVSLDNYRIAAAEQLRTYAEIMGLDLDIVFSKEEFDTVLSQRRHSDLILIDTAGRSPMHAKRIYELREVFATHPPDEVHLVVAAPTKSDDLRVIMENFEPLSYDHVIVSKLDETQSLGAIYNINQLCGLPISYFTVGQSVPEDFRTATLSFIQAWIERGEPTADISKGDA